VKGGNTMAEQKLPDYRRLFDRRYDKYKKPDKVKAYKLTSLTKEDGYKTYTIKSLDVHVVGNFRNFKYRFYNVIFNTDELKIVKEGKISGTTLKLYILLKSITDNGRFGIAIKIKPLVNYFSSHVIACLSDGIKYGFWDIYKVARLVHKEMPHHIIYFKRWWEEKKS
jgi:hypothetical protein